MGCGFEKVLNAAEVSSDMQKDPMGSLSPSIDAHVELRSCTSQLLFNAGLKSK